MEAREKSAILRLYWSRNIPSDNHPNDGILKISQAQGGKSNVKSMSAVEFCVFFEVKFFTLSSDTSLTMMMQSPIFIWRENCVLVGGAGTFLTRNNSYLYQTFFFCDCVFFIKKHEDTTWCSDFSIVFFLQIGDMLSWKVRAKYLTSGEIKFIRSTRFFCW